MTIDILTLFPEMLTEVFSTSIIGRAQKKGFVKINLHNLRDWTTNKHKTATPAKAEPYSTVPIAGRLERCGRVDDTPYGGGAGMVLKVDVIDRAIASLRLKVKGERLKVILLTPKGKAFTQQIAQRLSKKKRLILICGHYEGFDERVRKLVDEEISIGNYILTGGEIPAMIMVDAITRLVPGVINPESLEHESFSQSKSYKLKAKSYLEYPQYTRPEIYKPMSIKTKRFLSVPKILLSGNHSKIATWRKEKRKIINE